MQLVAQFMHSTLHNFRGPSPLRKDIFEIIVND